jgi:hypothetical protein
MADAAKKTYEEVRQVREEAARRYSDEDDARHFVAGWASKDEPETIEAAKHIPVDSYREAFAAGVEFDLS